MTIELVRVSYFLIVPSIHSFFLSFIPLSYLSFPFHLTLAPFCSSLFSSSCTPHFLLLYSSPTSFLSSFSFLLPSFSSLCFLFPSAPLTSFDRLVVMPCNQPLIVLLHSISCFLLVFSSSSFCCRIFYSLLLSYIISFLHVSSL